MKTIKNQGNNTQDLENIIIKDILSSQEIDLDNVSNKDLKIFVDREVRKANYLKEEWQVDYAAERIIEKIKAKIDPEDEIEEKKDRKKYIYSMLLAFCFYFFVQITFEVWGLLFFFIAFIPINMLIGNRRARKIIIELSISAVISPFIAHGLFGGFDTTETLNPLLIIGILIGAFMFFEIIRFICRKIKRYLMAKGS